jgi:hypothetical protein
MTVSKLKTAEARQDIAAIIKRRFAADFDTGTLTRLPLTADDFPQYRHYNATFASKPIGCENCGYTQVNIGYQIVLGAHVIVWTLWTGVAPPACVDHISGERNDNRPCNLRAVSYAENIRNSPKRREARRRAGFKGFTYTRKNGLLHAHFDFADRRIHLGPFATPLELSMECGDWVSYLDEKLDRNTLTMARA